MRLRMKQLRKTFVVFLISSSAIVLFSCSKDENSTGLPEEQQTPANKIVFTSDIYGHDEIFIMNFDGSQKQQITSSYWADFNPAWSPDKKQIVFVSDRYSYFQYNIYVMNSAGKNVIQLTSSNYDNSPCWSPDGKKIVFLSNRSGPSDIFIMDSDGKNQTQITTGGYNFDPQVTSDGNHVVYSHQNFTNHDISEIFIMNIDGSNQQQITEIGKYSDHPSVSRDGKKIAFRSNMDNYNDIFIMNIDGSDISQLTQSSEEFYNSLPDFCCCSDKIVFCSKRDGDSEIFTMNIDGSNQQQLTFNDDDDSSPDW